MDNIIHYIFFELAINHGLPSSLIIFLMMIFIIIFSWRVNSKLNRIPKSSEVSFKKFDKAWIISFIIFLLIHIIDITYFDGRISTTSWILLSGMVCIIKGKKTLNKPY